MVARCRETGVPLVGAGAEVERLGSAMRAALARCDGYFVARDVLGSVVCTAMREDAQRLYAAGRFGESMSIDLAGVTYAKPGVFSLELDAADYDAAPHLLAYTRELVLAAPNVLPQVDRAAYGTKLAITLRGAAYPRHVDNACVPRAGGPAGHPADRRWITVIYYLNPHWTPDDGGELRLWQRNQDRPIDIAPTGDTMVAFYSDSLVHEVLPSNDADGRYALTTWLVAGDGNTSSLALCSPGKPAVFHPPDSADAPA